MKHNQNKKASAYAPVSLNILIFAAFSAGLYMSYTAAGNTEPKEIRLMFYLLLIVFSFIASSSVLGLVLLPAAAFLFGAGSYTTAGLMIENYFSGAEVNSENILVAVIFFPAFFIISSQGMKTSILLINSLCGCSMADKDKFNKIYIPILFCLGLVTLAAYFFIR